MRNKCHAILFGVVVYLFSLLPMHSVMSEKNSRKLITIPVYNFTLKNMDKQIDGVSKLFDGDPGTRVVAYISEMDVLIDLQKEYEIEKILIDTDKESGNFTVGVGFQSFEPEVYYPCEYIDDYICQPQCNHTIIARFIYWRVKFDQPTWFSSYEITIKGYNIPPESYVDDLAYRRPVWPVDCSYQAGLVVGGAGTGAPNLGDKPLQVAFNAEYSILRVGIMADKEASITMMLTGKQKSEHRNVSMSLSDCELKKKIYMCPMPIEVVSFSSIRLTIAAPGLSVLKVYGEPIYYSLIQLVQTKTASRVRLTFNEVLCDLSMHSNCNRTGVSYQCQGMRFYRIASNGALTHLIVDKKKILDPWAKGTDFKLEESNKTQLVVSMPRSYEYLGTYLCACSVNDANKRIVFSDRVHVTTRDILNGINERTKYSYKVGGVKGSKKRDIKTNLVIIRSPRSGFFQFYVNFLSITDTVKINLNYMEEALTNSSLLEFADPLQMKAFPGLEESWTIQMWNCSSEIAPTSTNGAIKITWFSEKLGISDSDVIYSYKPSEEQKMVQGWLWKRTDEFVEFRIFSDTPHESVINVDIKGCVQDRVVSQIKISESKCVQGINTTCIPLPQYNGQLAIIKLASRVNDKYTLSIHKPFDKKRQLAVAEKMETGTLEKVLKVVNLSPIVWKLEADNTLVVRITVKTKEVVDFIACGSVEAKITLPDGSESQSVLTLPYVDIKVKPDPDAVNFKISVTIIMAVSNSSVTKSLTITNPYNLKVPNLSVKADKFISMTWGQIPSDVWKVFVGFEVFVLGTVQACQENYRKYRTTVSKRLSYTPTAVYSAKPLQFPGVAIIEHTLGVRPIFKDKSADKGKSFGVMVYKNVTTESSKTTTVELVGPTGTSSQRVRVITGQRIDCDIKSVIFDVQPKESALTINAIPVRLENDKYIEYNITNLDAGREYTLQATVKYLKGSDQLSKEIEFVTYDDMWITKETEIIPKNILIADLNKPLEVRCSARLGSNQKRNAKTLAWRMSDSKPLISRTSFKIDQDDGSAILQFRRIEWHHQGVYRCFIAPKQPGSPKTILTLYVNGVTLSESTKIAPYFTDVNVTCKAPKAQTISWYRLNGDVITAIPTGKVNATTGKEFNEATLSLKNVSFADTGIYRCLTNITGFEPVGKNFNLVLVERATVKTGTPSSRRLGDEQRLVCTGFLAHKKQVPRWQLKLTTPPVFERKIASLHEIGIKNSLGAQGNYTCLIAPKTEMSTSARRVVFEHTLVPSSFLKDRDLKVPLDKPLRVTCYGYANNTGQRAIWRRPGEPTLMTTTEAPPATTVMEVVDLEDTNNTLRIGEIEKDAAAPPPPAVAATPPAKSYQEVEVSEGSTLDKTVPEESTLTFAKTSLSDSGVYKCLLIDATGAVLSYTDLNLKVEKKVIPKTRSEEVKYGGGNKGTRPVIPMSVLILVSLSSVLLHYLTSLSTTVLH